MSHKWSSNTASHALESELLGYPLKSAIFCQPFPNIGDFFFFWICCHLSVFFNNIAFVGISCVGRKWCCSLYLSFRPLCHNLFVLLLNSSSEYISDYFKWMQAASLANFNLQHFSTINTIGYHQKYNKIITLLSSKKLVGIDTIYWNRRTDNITVSISISILFYFDFSRFHGIMFRVTTF